MGIVMPNVNERNARTARSRGVFVKLETLKQSLFRKCNVPPDPLFARSLGETKTLPDRPTVILEKRAILLAVLAFPARVVCDVLPTTSESPQLEIHQRGSNNKVRIKRPALVARQTTPLSLQHSTLECAWGADTLPSVTRIADVDRELHSFATSKPTIDSFAWLLRFIGVQETDHRHAM